MASCSSQSSASPAADRPAAAAGTAGSDGMGTAPATSLAAWAGVGKVFGQPGKFKGGVFSVSFPRSDLQVKVGDVALKPALSTTTSVAFFGTAQQATVMADLVLTEGERQAVLSQLTAGGIAITAVHEHLPSHSPTVWWHHIEGSGDATALARTIKNALAATGTSMTPPSSSPAAPLGGLDQAALDKAVGRIGTVGGGVLKYTITRAKPVMMGQMTLPPSQTQTVLGFQPMGGGRAAVNGDIVMTAEEVQPVLSALRQGGLQVIELHNHMLDEQPRLLYVHFWAVDDASRLATALRAAVDKTDAAPAQ